jgi:hypothetical protein
MIHAQDVGNVLRAAYERHPDHPATVRRLARYLFSTDALEELVRELGPTQCDSGADAESLHFVGLAASVPGDRALAERCLARAAAAGHRESLGYWVKALNALGRTEEAYSVGMRTLEDFPYDDPTGQVVFGILLAEKRYTELWDLCLRLRSTGGWTARMVSAMALAAQTPDRQAAVRQMTDQNIWLEQTKLGFEDGYTASLSRYLDEMNVWTPLPRTRATVGRGKRIERMHTFADKPLLNTVFTLIRTAIAGYIDKRAALFADSVPDQPMAAMRPENLTLTSWTVAVNMDGHEEWHIHPDGWLSGVFYVDVPDLSATDSPHAGQIEFGPYPFGASVDNAVWPRRSLQPRTGDLLLFPSYFAHRTWPTHVARDRICIAFDVLRRGIDNLIETHKNACARNDFGPDDRLARHERTVCSATDVGSYMIMNVDTGRYLATDETGALLWKLLNEPHTTRELTGLLLREFDAVEAEMTRDVASVLRVMVACDLAAVV